ncbi:dolichyl-phosphate beta-glucosyltransferase [Sphaerobacter thermophilus]|jgi:glycosyltransferase involved in cell wall biosynthesis|uniref:dolichyl-phosphate beta-glucosyltransferase n=1 Tax=Sphaerobacter thermophilus (strain ATCC 49802 / DSM 20745 / KCCM 41009 / NCIMB 13125 / S 6022) TaxID=479434 RepID=D1C487_SPHTD|nr:dolichyl-phosphate beta-glucosyltransferase [Sphaerobacter thermophilus]ACZ39054.1 glycosyl transferase family 2 [Sphaerobacter thermophilus DSM 20745]PZN63835.1 MAG: glycosyltransferase family 2 protein [Sphaerobacter thermophilus]
MDHGYADQDHGQAPQPRPEAAAVAEQSVEVSVVVPAYNEASRLPKTLAAAISYLGAQPYSWELIVADDGSEDATPDIAAAAAAADPRVRHLRLPHRGKAAAVHAGVRAARGEIVVFTDADLSTPIEYVADVRRLIQSGWDVVIGTREGAGARRIGEPFYRHVMGRLYNYLVQLLAVPGIKDTQCGFKGFSGAAAREVFGSAWLYRNGAAPVRGPLVTGFDVELLFLARKRGFRVAELPVTWRHVDGSKVRPGIDSLLMVRDVVRVRWNDFRGRYGR